ncbi:MAG: hypothetical protein ACRCZH_03435 [Cetobacterium sp.]
MKKILVLGILFGSLNLYANNDVYTTPKGKVYHSKETCKTLSRSKTIIKVKVKDVGNRRPCKVC